MIKSFYKYTNESADAISSYYPIMTKSSVTDYYECENCGALYKKFNKEISTVCPYCHNKTAKVIDEDDWYRKVASRLTDPYEVKYLYKEKEQEDNTLLDMVLMGKIMSARKRRRHIN